MKTQNLYVLRAPLGLDGFEYIQESWKVTTIPTAAKIFRTKREAEEVAKRLDYIGLNRRPNSFKPFAL